MMHSRRARSLRGGRANTRATMGLALSIGTLFIVLLLLGIPANSWAYRPFVSTDAAVADPKEVEIELGYFTLERGQGENTFTIPSLVLNYGLGWDIEVVGEFRVERAPMGDIDLVDPGLSLKAVLKEGLLQGKPGLSVAVEAGPLLPSTRPGERSFGVEGIGIVSGRLEPFTLHVNLGGGLDRRDAQLFALWGVIGELSVGSNLRLVGEVAGESTTGALPNNSALLGFIWQPSESNLFLDAGVRRGISRGAPDWQLTAGMTFGFTWPSSRRDASHSREAFTRP
jgi:hypothetical protein